VFSINTSVLDADNPVPAPTLKDAPDWNKPSPAVITPAAENCVQIIGVVPIVAVEFGDETTHPVSACNVPSVTNEYSPPSTS